MSHAREIGGEGCAKGWCEEDLCERLECFSKPCDLCQSGKESLEKVEDMIYNKKGEQEYKIIFMDYSMPEMDGLETTARIL